MPEFLQQINWPSIVLWVVTIVFATAIVSFFLNLRIPRVYNIAVIGSPRSGKTTLIISLFGQILSGRVKSLEATLSSVRTTERVMSGIARLEMGKALNFTDKDLFVYRSDVVIGAFSNQVIGTLFKKTYRVEIADFGGQQLAKSDNTTAEPLIDPEYAKWVNEADAFIFVIDIGPCFVGVETGDKVSRQYAINMTAAFRAAWQNVLNQHTAGSNKVRSYPLVLAFSKSDLINFVPEKLAELERLWAFGNLPGIVNVDSQRLAQYAPSIREAFSDLRKFFQQTSDNYEEVFVSSVGNLNGDRLGFDSLLRGIFPDLPG